MLKVKISIPNVRLFVGNIPKEMTKEDIFFEFQKQSRMILVFCFILKFIIIILFH